MRVAVSGSSPLMDHLMALPPRQRAAEVVFLAEAGRRLLSQVGGGAPATVPAPASRNAPAAAQTESGWLDSMGKMDD